MTQILTLVRHAKSSWNHPYLSDFERPLNKRGLKNAPDMGKRLATQGYKVNTIISSPATRAITTAEFIASQIEFNIQKIRQDERIYEASLNTLINLVKTLDNNSISIMLVGHNPGFTMLCNYLTDANAKVDNMPTCAVAQIEFNENSWGNITEHSGKLIDFDYPRKKI